MSNMLATRTHTEKVDIGDYGEGLASAAEVGKGMLGAQLS